LVIFHRQPDIAFLLKYIFSLLFRKLIIGLVNIFKNTISILSYTAPASQSACSIVALVTRMLCDALELRLKERAGVQGRLAGAVVKQVAGGA